MDAQLQIRQNALEAQDYMRDLLDWQQSMKQKAGSKSSKAPDQDVPAVRGKTVGSVHSPPEDLQQPAMQPSKAPAASAASPAAHTYAHYSKWDKYNPDAAADDDDQPPGVERQRPSRPQQQAPPTAPQQVQSTTAAANGTSKQAPAQASPPSATSLKDQGNKLFQQGQYLEAIQCYTQSIGLQATAVAYANRAMARLKLKQYAEAEQDCSAALQLDGSYIKALHRRGTARRQLGKLLEAAADFEEALRLEPGNATVRADRDAALEQHLQQQKIQPSTTWSSIPVLEQQQQRQEQGGQQQQQGQEVKQVSAPQQQLAQAASTGPDAATGSEPPSCSSGPVTAAAVDAVSSAVTGPDSSGPSGRPGGSRPPPAARSPSPQQASTAAAAAAAAAQLAARLAANLKAPKNSNEFEAAWRSFKGDAQLQARYLALVQPQQLPAIFKTSLTAPMLTAVLSTALTAAAAAAAARPVAEAECQADADTAAAAAAAGGSSTDLGPAHAVSLVEALVRVPRFDMAAMCLTGRDKARLRQQWEAAAGSCEPHLAGVLAAVRPKYKL